MVLIHSTQSYRPLECLDGGRIQTRKGLYDSLQSLARIVGWNIYSQIKHFTLPGKLIKLSRSEPFYSKLLPRSDITVVCKGMQFVQYPLDRHTCYLKFSSCKYSTKRGSCDGQDTGCAIMTGIGVKELSKLQNFNQFFL